MTAIRYILVLLLWLALFGTQAQKRTELLKGSWQMTAYREETDTLDRLPFQRIVSYYPNGVFQDISFNKNKDTLLFEMGKWKVKHKHILLQDVLYQNCDAWCFPKYRERLLTLNDTLLSKSSWKYDMDIFSQYSKIPNVPLRSFHAYVQKQEKQYDFYLVNSADSSRKVLIDNRISFELKTLSPVSPMDKKQSIKGEGFVIGLKKDKLQFNGFQEVIDTYDQNTKRTEVAHHPENVRINISSILQVEYQSNRRNRLNLLGGYLVFLSGVTALVAAPLTGINYSKGGFSTSRYFTLAGIGLAGAGIGIPLMLLTRKKTYRITEKHQLQDRDHWYFDSKLRS